MNSVASQNLELSKRGNEKMIQASEDEIERLLV
jgi:hypothetical protein